jgi:carbon-monoxide dehydrogenase medium subunit
VEQICTGPGRSALGPGEFLVSIRLPQPPARFGARYLRFIPRNEMDIAVVGVGVSVTLAPDWTTIEDARVALGAVGPTPILAEEAGAVLRGKPASPETILEAARAAQAAARPITDMRGTAEQRRHLVMILTRRALEGALERARGTGGGAIDGGANNGGPNNGGAGTNGSHHFPNPSKRTTP